MTYNPYESKKAKHNRIVSNIIIIAFCVAFVLCLWYLFFGDKTVKVNYHFDTVTAKYQTEHNSEFEQLKVDLLLTSKLITKNEAFDAEYPTVSALLDFDSSVYNPEKPFVMFSADSIACAQVLLSEVDDYRVLEVITAKASQSVSDSEITIDMNDFTAYSVMYNTRTGDLTYQDYSDETFHLDIYSLGFEISGIEPTDISYYVNLSSKPEDSINLVYDAINQSNYKEKAETSDIGFTASANYKSKDVDKAKLTLQLDRNRLGTLKNAQFKIKTNGSTDVITTLSIN